MAVIHRLDQQTVNKIAAGEVVERPASIVKELLENAIDAGSTSVTVEIRGGGLELIRITDNGHGMEDQDALLAFEPHATSKIHRAEDVDCVLTMGFRGEALPSIAAVSHLEMTTRQPNSLSGYQVRLEGGNIVSHAPAGCPEGTGITVRNLFFNTPARLRFMKKTPIEAALAGDIVLREILAHPKVSIRLIKDRDVVYHSPGDGDLRGAYACVYGHAAAQGMLEVRLEKGQTEIEGLIAPPDQARHNRSRQSLFINSRFVRHAEISRYIEHAYGSRLMKGKFPSYALHIHLNPERVNVNVHPNKLEVRLFQEEEVCQLACQAVEQALGQSQSPMPDLTRQLNRSQWREAFMPMADRISLDERQGSQATENPTAKLKIPSVQPAQEKTGHAGMDDPHTFNGPPAAQTKAPFSLTPSHIQTLLQQGDHRETVIRQGGAALDVQVGQVRLESLTLPQAKAQDTAQAKVASGMEVKAQQQMPVAEVMAGKIIGQLFDTYLVVEQGDKLYIIDQHAAHERLLYERFAAFFNRQQVLSQPLMIPYVIDVTADEHERIEVNLELFTQLGFVIEPFGPRTYQLREIPVFLGQPQAQAFFLEMVDHLELAGRLQSTMERRDTLVQLACKKAVKANDPLDAREIAALIEQTQQGDTPLNCPHGRPILLEIDRADLEKRFKRV